MYQNVCVLPKQTDASEPPHKMTSLVDSLYSLFENSPDQDWPSKPTSNTATFPLQTKIPPPNLRTHSLQRRSNLRTYSLQI